MTFDCDDQGNCTSEIYNKPTGNRIPINEVGPKGCESYEFDMWVQVGNKKGVNSLQSAGPKVSLRPPRWLGQGPIWSRRVLIWSHGVPIWSHMVPDGSQMAPYGLIWSPMAPYGPT